MEITFKKNQPWARMPEKFESTDDLDGKVYSRWFRWVRRERTPAKCWPWRLGHQVGWVIPSPVDVQVSPLDDVEIDGDPSQLEEFGRVTGYDEVWRRPKSSIAVRGSTWLRMYDYLTPEGWRGMFIPNGMGTVEWHLGWSIEIPEGYYVMFLPPAESAGWEVPFAVLDRRTIVRLNSTTGVALAFKPTKIARISRGEPIARIVVLHPDSVRATGRWEEDTADHDDFTP